MVSAFCLAKRMERDSALLTTEAAATDDAATDAGREALCHGSAPVADHGSESSAKPNCNSLGPVVGPGVVENLRIPTYLVLTANCGAKNV